MARRRSRTRTRGRDGPGGWTGLLVALAVVIAASGPATVAVTTGQGDRQESVDVVGDTSGVQRLNVTTELEEGVENCLVEVTNHLGQEVTVAVTLRDDSRQYGKLKVTLLDTVKEGDSVEFTLADGDTQTVKMDVDAGSAGNTTYFHVNSSATGIYAETRDRSAPIVSSGDTTCA